MGTGEIVNREHIILLFCVYAKNTCYLHLKTMLMFLFLVMFFLFKLGDYGRKFFLLQSEKMHKILHNLSARSISSNAM